VCEEKCFLALGLRAHYWAAGLSASCLFHHASIARDSVSSMSVRYMSAITPMLILFRTELSPYTVHNF
jgi:hypothetical protein